jgi:hypothetical protein
MAGGADARRPIADGALPLAALLAPGLLFAALQPALYGLAALYLTFAGAMASGGAERPGEPEWPWRLYAVGAGALAVLVPLGGFVAAAEHWPLAGIGVIAAGFASHVAAKRRHGVHRPGLLSACGRREHDARIGRTLEGAVIVLAGAAALPEPAGPALYAIAGWLLAAASVAERDDGASSGPEDRPPASAPAPAA